MLPGRSNKEESWLTRGWAERTGYNPPGVGEQGLGAVTGYTLQEVAEIPLLSAQELLEYQTRYVKHLASSSILCPPPNPCSSRSIPGSSRTKTTIGEEQSL